MKANYRVDYRQQTAAYYTTYIMPSEIRQGLEYAKQITVRIAGRASDAIAAEAQQFMNEDRGRFIDRLA